MKRLIVALALLAGTAASARAQAITPVLDPYLRIQESLAADKTDKVKADAGALADAAAKLTDGKEIVDAARQLEGAADIKAARSAFGKLSEAVIKYGDTHKGAVPDDLRVAYCPMADRSWLQKSDQIANPYFGSAMLKCGEIKKKKS